MTALGKKILALLEKNPSGLKASEIAEKLNITRRSVNQFLYYQQTDFINLGEPDYKWVPRYMVERIAQGIATGVKLALDPVMSKLNNQKNAKVFTSKQFNAIANWKHCKACVGTKALGTHKTKTGNLIDYQSKSELMMLKYLEENNFVAEIGGQNLCISYDTAFREDIPYYPDIVALKNDGHIAIIEVKSIMAMSNHTNIEKYKALSAYCVARGYEYMMIAPDYNYMTFDELSKLHVPMSISSRISTYLRNLLGQEGEKLLEPSDVPILYKEFTDICDTQEKFELYLHALVIQKGWYNKFSNGFMVYENPQK